MTKQIREVTANLVDEIELTLFSLKTDIVTIRLKSIIQFSHEVNSYGQINVKSANFIGFLSSEENYCETRQVSPLFSSRKTQGFKLN